MHAHAPPRNAHHRMWPRASRRKFTRPLRATRQNLFFADFAAAFQTLEELGTQGLKKVDV